MQIMSEILAELNRQLSTMRQRTFSNDRGQTNNGPAPVGERPMSSRYPQQRQGTRIKFVTTLDLVDLGHEKVRFGAIGIWDVTSGRIAFRFCDMIDYGITNLPVYEEDCILEHRAVLEIEDAM